LCSLTSQSLESSTNFYLCFPYYPIWMKFGTRNLYIMLLSVCEFRQNRRREGCTLPVGVNKITFKHAQRNHMAFWT
jgi:hypothetical protein